MQHPFLPTNLVNAGEQSGASELEKNCRTDLTYTCCNMSGRSESSFDFKDTRDPKALDEEEEYY